VAAVRRLETIGKIHRLSYSYEKLIEPYGVRMTVTTATLSSKYQISIPKAVREEQHWQAGQKFVFIPKGKGVLVMPVPEAEELAGIARGSRTRALRDRADRF
jgi:AbrB family looped-hinge helix DNA binding protein